MKIAIFNISIEPILVIDRYLQFSINIAMDFLWKSLSNYLLNGLFKCHLWFCTHINKTQWMGIYVQIFSIKKENRRTTENRSWNMVYIYLYIYLIIYFILFILFLNSFAERWNSIWIRLIAMDMITYSDCFNRPPENIIWIFVYV